MDRRKAAASRGSASNYLNFLYGLNATPEQVRRAYDPEAYERLTRLKAVYDPANLFRLNPNIPPVTG